MYDEKDYAIISFPKRQYSLQEDCMVSQNTIFVKKKARSKTTGATKTEKWV